MSTIACLGWGSLIWDPRDLPVSGGWRSDGPSLPLEFARISSRGKDIERLTLVIVPGYGARVISLWTFLSVNTPEAARATLSKREGCPERLIGLWRATDSDDPLVPEIAAWARGQGVTEVVWTDLRANFGEGGDRLPTADEAMNYLKGLTAEKLRGSEEYIRKAPAQIDTPYRRRFVAEFEWAPI
jgi:hypothetical protein